MTHSHSGGCCGGGHRHAHVEAEGDASPGGCCSGKPAGQCCKTRPPAIDISEVITAEQFMAWDTDTLVARYRRGIEVLDDRVLQLGERQLDQAFLESAGVGTWPVRVLLGHLADAELVYVHRMRRAVGEDNPVLAVFDENAFIDANLYGNRHEGYADDPEQDRARVMHALGGFLTVIHTLRQWHSSWLYGLEAGAFERGVMHPERGRMTVKTLLAYDTWHIEHHARFLRKKMDLLVGVREPMAAGGCGCSH